MAARLMAVIETSKMANGLTLASVGMANSNSVSLGVWVKAGARDERTQEMGVAHFLEHMAFKGTHSRTALSIAKDIENVGGFINEHTAREETAYYINLLPEHLEMGFDILSDILLNSTLPAEEIERERGVIIQEIGQSIDSPDDHVFECFSRACLGKHTLGNSILGTTDSVSSFTAPELAGFMQRYYGAEQMVICVAGPITHQQLSGLASQYFDKLKQADALQRKAPEFLSTRHIASRDLEQCHTVLVSGPGCPVIWVVPADGFIKSLWRRYVLRYSSRLGKSAACAIPFSPLPRCLQIQVCLGYMRAPRIKMSMKCWTVSQRRVAEGLPNRASSGRNRQIKTAIAGSGVNPGAQDSVSSMMETTALQLVLFDRVFEYEEMLAAIEKVSREDIAELRI